jgi:hypothetical protein
MQPYFFEKPYDDSSQISVMVIGASPHPFDFRHNMRGTAESVHKAMPRL